MILGYTIALTMAQATSAVINQMLGRKTQSISRDRSYLDQLELQARNFDNARQASAETADRSEQFQVAQQHRQHHHTFQAAHWPLRIPPSDFQRIALHRPGQPVVIFIPPQVDTAIMSSSEMSVLFSEWIRQFTAAYSPLDPMRPLTFLGDVWIEGKARSETALHLLCSCAPDVPVLLIQLDYAADQLRLRAGLGGFDGDHGAVPLFADSANVDLLQELADLARQDARGNRLIAAKIAETSHGVSLLTDHEVRNMQVLEIEEAIGTLQNKRYNLEKRNAVAAMQKLGPGIQLAIAAVADFYFYRSSKASPLLPRLLPDIARQFPQALGAEIASVSIDRCIKSYAAALLAESDAQAPERLLDLAEMLSEPQLAGLDPTAAAKAVDAAVVSFLRLRGLFGQQTDINIYLHHQLSALDLPVLHRASQLWRASGKPALAALISPDTTSRILMRRLNAANEISWEQRS